MKFAAPVVLFLAAVAGLTDPSVLVNARKPSRSAASARRGPSSRTNGRPASRPSPRKRYEEDDYDADLAFLDGDDLLEEEDDDVDIVDDDVIDDYDEDGDGDDYEEEEILPRRRPSTGGRPSKSRKPPRSSNARSRPSSSAGKSRSSRSSRYVDDEDDYGRPPRPSGRRRPPPTRSGQRRPAKNRGGRMVPYTQKPQQPSTFVRGLDVIKNSMPDPSYVRQAAAKSISAARETTSSLSANIYREVKGLTSSELEQVMLKATRPDDTPVKGKHVERLVGVTYQISSRYDIYDAVLRKLWSKMSEKDWRTNIKALYILHRFSADGAPEHAPALKARLREMRRTLDPKRKEKFFSSKLLLAGDNSPQNKPFKAFMARYAHYVLLRAQCFSGMFDEIANLPAVPSDRKKKSSSSSSSPVRKPITSTCLKQENYDAAEMLLKAGVACQLRKGEACENTAIATERVAADLMSLCSAVATALNRALKDDDLKGADPVVIKKWCELYSDKLVPQTKSMVKKTSPKLDKFGLFLPSRMSTSVTPDLIQKGLALPSRTSRSSDGSAGVKDDEGEDPEEVDTAQTQSSETNKSKSDAEEEGDNDHDDGVEHDADDDGDDVADDGVDRQSSKAAADDEDEYDEYEYDEEYYDDEEF